MARGKTKNKKKLKRKKRGFLYVTLRIMLCLAVALLVWPVYFVVLYKFVPVYYTPLMLQRYISCSFERFFSFARRIACRSTEASNRLRTNLPFPNCGSG